MELSIRLKKYGKICVNLDSVIYHEVAKSATITGQNTRKYYEIKSYIYFLKKLGWSYYFFGQIYNFLRLIFNFILSVFISNRKEYYKILFKANRDFLNSRLGVFDLKNNKFKKKKSVNLYLKKIF